MNIVSRLFNEGKFYNLFKMTIVLILTLGMSLTVTAEPPDPCATPLLFADMEYSDLFVNGWGTYNGGDVGVNAGSDGSDVPPLNGGNYALSVELTDYGSGGFGGFFRTFPLDLTGMTHFNFWINPAAGQNYLFDVNLQEDDNNDNTVNINTPDDDDEFQYDLTVGPHGSGADIISGGGWQLISIPLADFFDDNSIFQGNDIFDPFPSGDGQLINVVFAYVLNPGETIELRTDNWFFSCGDGFCSSMKTASNIISGNFYPTEAASDIAAAVADLNAAVIDCESNDVQEAYEDLEDALNELMDAAENGADVSEEIAYLLATAQSDINGEYADAYKYYGIPEVDNYINKANDFIADAAVEASEGDYNLTIRRLASARKELQRAILLGSTITLDVLIEEDVATIIDEIQDLIDNGGYSSNADAELQDAIDELDDAYADFSAGNARNGFNDLQDAVEQLQDAEDDGANATDEINAIVNLAKKLAEVKISEAQNFAGNPETDARLARAQADMSDAMDALNDGRPDRAVKEYRDAWDDARIALEHGRGLRKVDDETVTSLTPETFSLAQNYPNPFNPSTNIAFQIADAEFVNLKIYDISGRLVKTLVNENRTAGNYTEQWDGSNSIGQKVGSGIYFYQITAGTFQQIKKMMLIK